MSKEILYTQRDIRAIEKDDEKKDYRFELSNEKADRYGTIIPFSSWDFSKYNLNPILAYNHWTGGNDPDGIIGKGTIELDETNKKIFGIAEFEPEDINPKAAKVQKKVDHGTLRAVSVGFIPIEPGHWGNSDHGEDPEIYYFGKVELIEFSIVDIPANPHALKQSLSLRSFLDNQKPVKKLSDNYIKRKLEFSQQKYGMR